LENQGRRKCESQGSGRSAEKLPIKKRHDKNGTLGENRGGEPFEILDGGNLWNSRKGKTTRSPSKREGEQKGLSELMLTHSGGTKITRNPINREKRTKKWEKKEPHLNYQGNHQAHL